MKRLLTLLLAGVLAAGALSACTSVPKKKTEPTDPTFPVYVPSSKTVQSQAEQDKDKQDTDVASSAARDEVKDTPSDASISDYVKNAKESVIILPGGGEKRCAIPEFLFDSNDAKAANSEILEKHGAYFDDPESHNYVSELNYEAYLYEKYLSVYIKSRVDGGNTTGLSYCFDITTGKELSSEKLCSMTGRDYNTAISKLKANLTSYYDEKFSKLPNNNEYRDKTLADSNLKASKMFLNESHQLTATVSVYAAVGGGNWFETISAE